MDIPIRAAGRESGGECDFGGRGSSAVGRNIGWIPTRRLGQIQSIMKFAGENVEREAGKRGRRRGNARGSLEWQRCCRVNVRRCRPVTLVVGQAGEGAIQLQCMSEVVIKYRAVASTQRARWFTRTIHAGAEDSARGGVRYPNGLVEQLHRISRCSAPADRAARVRQLVHPRSG